MAENKLTLTLDPEPLVAALNELQAFFDLLEPLADIPDVAAELVQRISELLDLPAELLCVNRDVGATAGTGESVVLIEPSRGLLDCVAAVRTFNRDFKLTDGILHKESSL